ncbi:MAG: pilus assembly protein [Parvibaculaceae bacterium]
MTLIPRFLRQTFRKTLRQDDGTSSVELALLLPLMISIYFGAVEISNALIADRKLDKTGNAVADLVAQAITLDDAAMADIFQASSSIMEPFDPSTLTVVVASVVADANNDTSVAWSDALNGSAYPVGAEYLLPAGLTSPGSSVIVAEATYTYTSPIGEYLTGGLTFSTRYFLRPRRVVQVARAN